MPTSPALYVRLSSDPGNDRKGVERQKRIMTARAEALGWGDPVIYEDNNKSSKAGVDRPDLTRMLAHLRSGVRDGLLIYKADRFSREPIHYDALKAAGALVASEYRTFDPKTSDGMKSLRDEAGAAEYETKKLSERLLIQRAEAAQEGRRHGAPAFGWGVRSTRKDGTTKWKKRDKINPEEAQAIRDGMDAVLRGESVLSIMKDWQARGLKTSRGGNWCSATVRGVLERWSNAGVRQHQGQPLFDVEVTWEPICDLPTLQSVRALLANNPRNNTTTRARRHLLSGVLACECGATMRGQHILVSAKMVKDKTGPGPEKPATHYKCTGNQCGRSVPYEAANVYVVNWLAHHLKWKSPTSFLPADVQAQITDITTALTALEERRSRIHAADLDESDALVMLSKVKKEREVLRARLDGFASASALSRLVASLKPIPMDGQASSFDIAVENLRAIRSNFLALDLKTQKNLLQALATFTVGVGFSPYNERGQRRKLKAHERIHIEPKH